MSSSDVDVTAYVDGELDTAARAEFEARLRQEPALQSQVERAQRLRTLLQSSYAPVIDEPVPQRLKEALLRPKVESLDAARARRRWTPTWAQLGGIAASVVLGLLIGQQIQPSATDSLRAQGELAQALNSKLSGEKLGSVSLGLSFMAKGGAYCRSFTTDDRAGLACRDGEGWQLRQLVPALKTTTDSAEYRTAASTLPPALLAAMDELREGDVLDAKQEASARGKGWR